MVVKAGDSLPDVTLFEGTPDTKTTLTKVFGNKTGILFGVPGAFSPGCSQSHVPGYVNDYDKLKQAGAEVIACVSVNDAFVMKAWGDSTGATGKVHMLADAGGELAKALGLELDAAAFFGNSRGKRFSAVVSGGKFKSVNVEPDGTGLSCSTSSTIISQLKE